MPVVTDEANRKLGIVFLDLQRSAGPASHVLIVGVGKYADTSLSALSSPPVSARAVADWFIKYHVNKAAPLASLALLLSEANPEPYEGASVPEATHANFDSALTAWLGRVNTNKANCSLIYTCGHGHSENGRTAILLQDYGTVPGKLTFGAMEIEQFTNSMQNASPVNQAYFFDCCRLPAGQGLAPNTTWGTPFVELGAFQRSHTETRNQYVVNATGPDEAATGRKNKISLFAESLLRALNGVAGDTDDSEWAIKPGRLIDIITLLMKLYRVPDQTVQTPGGKASGTFVLHRPSEPAAVPTYVSTVDPAQWKGCAISIRQNGKVVAKKKFDAVDKDRPFLAIDLAELTTAEIKATCGQTVFAPTRRKPRAPALFVELAEAPREASVETTPINGGPAWPSVKIGVISHTPTDFGAVATIRRLDGPHVEPLTVTAPMGWGVYVERQLELDSGDYEISVTVPSGLRLVKEVALVAGSLTKVTFDERDESPHEWLADAFAARAVPSRSEVGDDPMFPSEGPQAHAELLGRVRFGTMSPEITDLHTPKPEFVAKNFSRRFVRFHADWPLPLYEKNGLDVPTPLWARVTTENRDELCAYPTIGPVSPTGWNAEVVIDTGTTRTTNSASSVMVTDRAWAGTLGYLTTRDFGNSQEAFKDVFEGVQIHHQIKDMNPLAAAAGGLVAVSGSLPDLAERYDPWLKDLCEGFPTIPDGAIILARRLLMRAKSPEELDRARALFVEGFNRGIPIYSLALDWLVAGLQSFAGEKEVGDLLERARSLAARVDRTRTFTVIRLK